MLNAQNRKDRMYGTSHEQTTKLQTNVIINCLIYQIRRNYCTLKMVRLMIANEVLIKSI